MIGARLGPWPRWLFRPALIHILLLFAVTGAAQIMVFPRMEGHDEILHVTYVEHLRTVGALPDRTTRVTNCTRQASGQPPLTYALGALLLDLAGRPTVDCDMLRHAYDSAQNPWLNTPDPWNRRDNVRVFIPIQELPPFVAGNVYLLRGMALAWGLIAVAAAYGAGWTLFGSRAAAHATALTFGFMPLLLHLSAYFNNDISAVALATLILYRALHILRRGAGRFDWPLLGVLVGLGLLAKISVALILPAVGLALLWGGRARLMRQALAFALPPLLIVGPWVLYGLLTYGDPFGTATHYSPHLLFDPPRTPLEVMATADQLYITYIGKLGVNKVLLHPLTYAALGLCALLALIGWGYGVRGGLLRRDHLPIMSVLLIALLFFAAGFYYWYSTILFVSSRLLYPIHLIIVLGLVGGWWWLMRQRRAALGVVVGLFVAAGGLLTPLALVDAYRTPPPARPAALEGLRGPVYDFDATIRFLGYQPDAEVITEAGLGVRLCWEILRPPERRAAFSLKLVRDGEILADRTSLLGMGSYDSGLWVVGHQFCDRFFVPVDDFDTPPELEAPFRRDTRYDLLLVLLVLLDADTFDVNWSAVTLDGVPVQFPFVDSLYTVP